MAKWTKLNKRVSHVGVPITDDLMLITKLDSERASTFSSDIVGEYRPQYPMKDLELSSFTLSIPIDNERVEPFWVVDMRATDARYTFDEVLDILSRTTIDISQVFFFNTVNMHTIKDALSVSVKVPGHMILEVEVGKMTYMYEDTEQSMSSKLISHYIAAAYGMDHRARRLLESLVTDQIEILKLNVDIDMTELDKFMSGDGEA